MDCNSLDALTERDRVHGWLALRFCTEAVVQSAFARQGIYFNPIELKWLPNELNLLQQKSGAALSPALRLLASDGVRVRSTRFERLAEMLTLS